MENDDYDFLSENDGMNNGNSSLSIILDDVIKLAELAKRFINAGCVKEGLSKINDISKTVLKTIDAYNKRNKYTNDKYTEKDFEDDLNKIVESHIDISMSEVNMDIKDKNKTVEKHSSDIW